MTIIQKGERMSDLISRQALCEYALNQKDKCVTPNDIMRFPSAQFATDINVGDNISRQAAIDAIDEIESEIAEGFGFEYEKWRKYFCDLPPAQLGANLAEVGTDCISRQQAIDAVVSAMIDGADAELVEGVMELLPSAQPVNYGSTKSDSSSQLKLNNDLISRQAVIVVFENSGLDDDSKDTAVRVLEQLPSAQTQRKKGKWINVNEGKWNTLEVLKCSVCGEMDNRMSMADNYCPSCGADMRGESDE